MTSLLCLIIFLRVLSFHFGEDFMRKPSSAALGIQNPQDISSSGVLGCLHPQKTDMAPENRPLAKEMSKKS